MCPSESRPTLVVWTFAAMTQLDCGDVCWTGHDYMVLLSCVCPREAVVTDAFCCGFATVSNDDYNRNDIWGAL